MTLEQKRLEKQIMSVKTQLSELPEGDFYCTRNGKYVKWFYTDGKCETYIPKKDRGFAEQMAEKKYLSLLLEDLIQEKQAIDYYLKHHSPVPGRAEQLFIKNPAYQGLLSSHFQTISDELLQWQNSTYKRNEKYPEQLIIKTGSGNKVRSKSEAMIELMQLITTYETKERPLSSETIEKW